MQYPAVQSCLSSHATNSDSWNSNSLGFSNSQTIITSCAWYPKKTPLLQAGYLSQWLASSQINNAAYISKGSAGHQYFTRNWAPADCFRVLLNLSAPGTIWNQTQTKGSSLEGVVDCYSLPESRWRENRFQGWEGKRNTAIEASKKLCTKQGNSCNQIAVCSYYQPIAACSCF